MVGYSLNPLWFLGGLGKRGPGNEEIATIISDLKVCQSLPVNEDPDGVLFITDMISISAPMILNLGPAGYDFAGDEGINGRLIERNLVAGVVSSYGFGPISDPGSGFFSTVMQPFGDEFSEVYSAVCQDFCWACSPYYEEDRSLSQAPAHPYVGNGILSTPYAPGLDHVVIWLVSPSWYGFLGRLTFSVCREFGFQHSSRSAKYVSLLPGFDCQANQSFLYVGSSGASPRGPRPVSPPLATRLVSPLSHATPSR